MVKVGGGCGPGSREGRSSCIISRVRGVGLRIEERVGIEGSEIVK